MTTMRQATSALLLTFSAVLAACAPLRGDPQIAATPDKVSLLMAQAADRASSALETLAAVEQSRSPGIAVAPLQDMPPELGRAMTVAWNGPVEPIARKLADRAGYAFRTVGAPPAVPIIVNINAENTPVGEILRNLGLQMGVRADIRVDVAARSIEIHYAPVTGAGG